MHLNVTILPTHMITHIHEQTRTHTCICMYAYIYIINIMCKYVVCLVGSRFQLIKIPYASSWYTERFSFRASAKAVGMLWALNYMYSKPYEDRITNSHYYMWRSIFIDEFSIVNHPFLGTPFLETSIISIYKR